MLSFNHLFKLYFKSFGTQGHRKDSLSLPKFRVFSLEMTLFQCTVTADTRHHQGQVILQHLLSS